MNDSSQHSPADSPESPERDSNEVFLLRAARALSGARRETMFEDLTKAVTDLLEADIGLLGLNVVEDGVSSIRTLACYAGGRFTPNTVYPLAGTPCETVVGQEFRLYPAQVGYLFPDSPAKQNRIESYAAYPLFDEKRRPLGVFTIMSFKEMHDSGRAESLLRIFSERAVAEIQRTEAEEALRSSEEHYRAIFNASVDGLALLSPEGVIVDVNPAMEALYGYSREEMIGRDPLEFTRERHRDNAARFLQDVSEQNFATMVDKAFHRDGSEFFIEPRGVKLEYQGRAHVLAIIRDVTEATVGEQALNQSEDRLRATVEAALECIVTMDEQGLVLDFNPAAEACFGYSKEEAVGRVLADLIIPERDRAAHTAGLKHYLESGKTAVIGRRLQVKAMRSDGTELPVELSLGTAQGPGGKIFIGYLRDITEREQAEAQRAALESQLRQAQKMEAIGHLTGGVAHDFNNILTSVLGYVELAHDYVEKHNDPKLNRYLERAQRSGERARDLIQQMLTFSRGQQGEPRSLALAPLIGDALTLLESMVPASIDIQARLSTQLPPVVQDPVHIEQILINLCINARDAMEGAGILTVALRETLATDRICSSCRQAVNGEFAELAISDTGPGMDEQLVDRIFEPFFSTKEAGKGSGMGLATVHGIVHECSGHIIVESKPGEGTTMRVFFPTVDGQTPAAPAPVDPAEATPAHAQFDGEVLVVDDNPSVSEFLDDLLSEWGLRVTVFNEGDAALKHFLARARAYDFVVLDQTMPTVTGLQLAEQMLRQRPELPVILYTGYSEVVDETIAMQAGIRALVRKPLDVEQFRVLVNEILG